MDVVEPEDIPLPDEPELEEESPYLRRQKAVAVRRSRLSRRLRLVLRGALFGILVLIPVGYVGYRLAAFALTSPRFLLTFPADVVVEGNGFVSRDEILSALGIPVPEKLGLGINLFRLSLEVKRKQVESIPWIRSATLTRAYPHRLAVHVVERTPVAFVNVGGQVKLVDAEGVLLEKPEKGVFDFPVLSGLEAEGGGAERRSRLALYEQFTRELAEEVPRSGWLVSEVDVTDADDLKALLIQGQETLLVHFGHNDFLPRFRNFLTLWPEVRKAHAKVDSVDLRYQNQIVVDPVGAVAPNPPGSGEADGRDNGRLRIE